MVSVHFKYTKILSKVIFTFCPNTYCMFVFIFPLKKNDFLSSILTIILIINNTIN